MKRTYLNDNRRRNKEFMTIRFYLKFKFFFLQHLVNFFRLYFIKISRQINVTSAKYFIKAVKYPFTDIKSQRIE